MYSKNKNLVWFKSNYDIKRNKIKCILVIESYKRKNNSIPNIMSVYAGFRVYKSDACFFEDVLI